MSRREAQRDAAWAEVQQAWRCPVFRKHAGTPGLCDGCGEHLTGRRTVWCGDACRMTWEREHYWATARNAARRRANHRCVEPGCTSTGLVEVNHIEPRAGRGYRTSCAHHASNLEALCHKHHLQRTAAQRASGAFA